MQGLTRAIAAVLIAGSYVAAAAGAGAQTSPGHYQEFGDASRARSSNLAGSVARAARASRAARYSDSGIPQG